MEPLLMLDPVNFIQNYLDPLVTETIWIGIMNHHKLDPEKMFEAVQLQVQSRENIQKIYDLLKNNPKIRWKDSIVDLLELSEETQSINNL